MPRQSLKKESSSDHFLLERTVGQIVETTSDRSKLFQELLFQVTMWVCRLKERASLFRAARRPARQLSSPTGTEPEEKDESVWVRFGWMFCHHRPM